MPSSDEIFEIKKKLQDHEKRIRKLESLSEPEKEKPIEERIGANIEEGIERLSTDAEISEEQLRHVYDFEKEGVRLIAIIEGKNEEEKQFKATVCILTAYHYCYGQDEIKSQDLRKILQWLDIKSLSILSSNLSKYKQFVIGKGKKKSPKFTYRITIPGIRQGLKIIKELAGE